MIIRQKTLLYLANQSHLLASHLLSDRVNAINGHLHRLHIDMPAKRALLVHLEHIDNLKFALFSISGVRINTFFHASAMFTAFSIDLIQALHTKQK